jgi:hypothetical protein
MNEIELAKKENFEVLYKKTKGYIEAATNNEKATIATTSELALNKPSFDITINKIITSIDAAGKAAVSTFDNYADLKAKSLGSTGITFKPTDLESKAKTIIPKITTLVTEKSYRGYSEVLTKLDPKIRETYPVKGPGLDTQELGRLCNGKNSALDIKKLLDTQLRQGETDLQDVINYIYVLKEAGLVTL